MINYINIQKDAEPNYCRISLDFTLQIVRPYFTNNLFQNPWLYLINNLITSTIDIEHRVFNFLINKHKSKLDSFPNLCLNLIDLHLEFINIRVKTAEKWNHTVKHPIIVIFHLNIRIQRLIDTNWYKWINRFYLRYKCLQIKGGIRVEFELIAAQLKVFEIRINEVHQRVGMHLQLLNHF
jgi:hypothetical protein